MDQRAATQVGRVHGLALQRPGTTWPPLQWCDEICEREHPSLNVRLPHVERWCAEAQLDVLALQETKLKDTMFSAISARTPLVGIQHDIARFDDPHEASAP